MENNKKVQQSTPLVKNKKPFWKKWWVWLIIVFVIIGIVSPEENESEITPIENKSPETKVERSIEKVLSPEQTEINPEPVFTQKLEEKNRDESIFIAESEPQPEVEPEPKFIEPEPEPEPASTNITLGQKNALKSARGYLDHSSFSRSGLIEQLEYEGFSYQESEYGVERCGANWNEQAVKTAQGYLNHSSFSRLSLIAQLEYEGFTSDQIEYGVKAVGY